MQILAKTTIDFMSKRKIALVFSAIILSIGIGSLVTKGLNFGLDFTGGTLIEVGYETAPEIGEVRERLANAGFDDAVVQTFGNDRDLIVRLPAEAGQEAIDLSQGNTDSISDRVLIALGVDETGAVEERRVEFVGPQIGDELKNKGGLALIWALSGIFLYIMFRFQWRFSVGAVAALVHDVLLTLGVLSILQIDFDLTVIAAILAVIGYSLNDTIVLYDRIRENFRHLRKQSPIDVINTSINQTLSRTVITSLTTLLVLAALFVFGGEIIHSFAITLIIGVIVGTYSSIFVASTAVLMLGVSKQDLMVIEKEGAGDNPLGEQP